MFLPTSLGPMIFYLLPSFFYLGSFYDDFDNPTLWARCPSIENHLIMKIFSAIFLLEAMVVGPWSFGRQSLLTLFGTFVLVVVGN